MRTVLFGLAGGAAAGLARAVLVGLVRENHQRIVGRLSRLANVLLPADDQELRREIDASFSFLSERPPLTAICHATGLFFFATRLRLGSVARRSASLGGRLLDAAVTSVDLVLPVAFVLGSVPLSLALLATVVGWIPVGVSLGVGTCAALVRFRAVVLSGVSGRILSIGDSTPFGGAARELAGQIQALVPVNRNVARVFQREPEPRNGRPSPVSVPTGWSCIRIRIGDDIVGAELVVLYDHAVLTIEGLDTGRFRVALVEAAAAATEDDYVVFGFDVAESAFVRVA